MLPKKNIIEKLVQCHIYFSSQYLTWFVQIGFTVNALPPLVSPQLRITICPLLLKLLSQLTVVHWPNVAHTGQTVAGRTIHLFLRCHQRSAEGCRKYSPALTRGQMEETEEDLHQLKPSLGSLQLKNLLREKRPTENTWQTSKSGEDSAQGPTAERRGFTCLHSVAEVRWHTTNRSH